METNCSLTSLTNLRFRNQEKLQSTQRPLNASNGKVERCSLTVDSLACPPDSGKSCNTKLIFSDRGGDKDAYSVGHTKQHPLLSYVRGICLHAGHHLCSMNYDTIVCCTHTP